MFNHYCTWLFLLPQHFHNERFVSVGGYTWMFWDIGCGFCALLVPEWAWSVSGCSTLWCMLTHIRRGPCFLCCVLSSPMLSHLSSSMEPHNGTQIGRGPCFLCCVLSSPMLSHLSSSMESHNPPKLGEVLVSCAVCSSHPHKERSCLVVILTWKADRMLNVNTSI